MSSADTHFIRSALPVREHARAAGAEDTCLALPQGHHLADRSARVQQQVQLTLARRSRRGPSNGNICPEDPAGTVCGRGFQYSVKSPLGLRGAEEQSIEGPTQRADVSLDISPSLPFWNHAAYSSIRYRSGRHEPHTLPPARASQLRYAHSERVLSKRLQAVAGVPFQKQQTAGSLREAYRGHQRSLSGQQQIDGLAFLANINRDGKGQSSRQGSYASSMVSVEMDGLVQQSMAEGVAQAMEQSMARGVTKQQQLQTLGPVPSGWKWDGQGATMTLERAAGLLSNGSTDAQLSAASCIQHQCFTNAQARRRVLYLRCIPKLVQLLQSDSEDLQKVAAAALRNAVFENDENKKEVDNNDGVRVLLLLLKNTRDIDTKKQLTGLLWNLSSHDLLKDVLSREALKTLTESAIIPCSGIAEGENPKDDLLTHPDIFFNATGCLRNLSSAGPETRRAMRQQPGLIDALVHYVQGTIADHQADDKSTENCVCILHNLSYQVQAEVPHDLHTPHSSHLDTPPSSKPIGCFGSRSKHVAQSWEKQLPLLEDQSNPHGVEWLWSPIVVRMYLSLLARSSRKSTQQAATGALLNITAGISTVPCSMAHTIVQRENGLPQVKRMLMKDELDVRKAAVALVRNVSRYSQLHGDIVQQVLPELISMLPNAGSGVDVSSDMTVSLCHILNYLSQSSSENVRAIVNRGGLPKVINISSRENGPTSVCQAASLLLHTMWQHKELRAAYRKAGYRKVDFINSKTVKAVNSLQDSSAEGHLTM